MKSNEEFRHGRTVSIFWQSFHYIVQARFVRELTLCGRQTPS